MRVVIEEKKGRGEKSGLATTGKDSINKSKLTCFLVLSAKRTPKQVFRKNYG